MNTITVRYKKDNVMVVEEVFENVVGHQVGGGCINIITEEGINHIVNNFLEATVVPDEKDQARNIAKAKEAYADVDDPEQVEDKPEAKVVPIK